MITHDEVRTLLNYTAREGVAVSLYLDMNVNTKGTLDIQTKDMIKDARKELNGLNINRSYLQAADENLEQIQKFVEENSATNYKSAAIFSNSTEKFSRIYRLPMPLKSRLVINTNFYVRPLLALLEEHYRMGVVLIDSRHAKFFEVYIGEILEHFDFSTQARNPRKPLLETFMKRDKRLAQRKVEDIRFHLSAVADLLKTHFLMRHFDKLIIGARKQLGDHLARILHPRLHENLIGIFEIDIHAKQGEILLRTLNIEKESEVHEENRLLRKIIDEIERGGYAVKGLRRVIEAAQDYSLQSVAVADDFSQPGFVCPGCGMPHLSEEPVDGKRTCVCCGRELIEAADVVSHLVEEAARQNAPARHIQGTNPAVAVGTTQTSLIRSLDNIAAVIKFKKSEFAANEEAVGTES